MLSIDVLEITLHSAAAEEIIIINYITFLDPGGINYVLLLTVIIVGPIVKMVLNIQRTPKRGGGKPGGGGQTLARRPPTENGFRPPPPNLESLTIWREKNR